MTHPVRIPRKLIETALPLDAINESCAAEKHPFVPGHPRQMHIYWARRPHGAARAVLFAQLVNDPSAKYEYDEKYAGQDLPNHIKASVRASRNRLFRLIEKLVRWENTIDDSPVLREAHEEIMKSWRETCELNRQHPDAATLFDPDKHPAFHDPFAGGGALPLEAQRLGLESWASDLNPVAVLINKAMIEIPPKFAGCAPVGPAPAGDNRMDLQTWKGAAGLAEDVRRYGQWMRDEAFKRIGHLYPQVEITAEMVVKRPDLKPYLKQKLTVIAWLWARTVKSPDPRFAHVDVPLVSNFVLSKKEGKGAWVEPVVEGDSYRFEVRVGKPPADADEGTKMSRGAKFRCILSTNPIDSSHVYSEAKAGRMGSRCMAIVCEGERGRVYLSPGDTEKLSAEIAENVWKPEARMPANPRWFSPPQYGLETYGDLFTPRQLVALNTFCDLGTEVRDRICTDAVKAGMLDDGLGLDANGQGATAYAEAVAVYLGVATSKWTDLSNSICGWNSTNQSIRNLFARQAIPMSWDFAELSPFSPSGSHDSFVQTLGNLLQKLPTSQAGVVRQADAANQELCSKKVISTDPPYYDNIGYADLSDFFYVWLRRSLRDIYPQVCATLATPKAEELVATPYRHGGKEAAETFFLNGMTQAMTNLAQKGHPGHLTTIYYAFKQSESDEGSTSSTGWATFLGAVIHSGFQITGTWPLRTERAVRSIGIGTNALASSIVLVCRRRPQDARTCTRADFQRELAEALPSKLSDMIFGTGENQPIHPADLAQAAIGPGMGIFSQYARILKQDGQELAVREALEMINAEIGRFFNEGASDLDRDSRFCLTWYQSHAYSEGLYGEAQVLANAKGSSVEGVVEAGVLVSGGGKARLKRVDEYPSDWDPVRDHRIPVWEFVHQLVRALREGGKNAAGELFKSLGSKARPARQLAYQLYTLAEQAGRADEARAWNELIGAWEDIETAAQSKRASQESLGI